MQQTPIDGFLSTLHVCHSRIYFTLEQISRNALCCFYSTTSKKYYFYNKILWSTWTSSRRGNQLQLGRDPSNLKTTSGSNWANWQSLRIAWVWSRWTRCVLVSGLHFFKYISKKNYFYGRRGNRFLPSALLVLKQAFGDGSSVMHLTKLLTIPKAFSR